MQFKICIETLINKCIVTQHSTLVQLVLTEQANGYGLAYCRDCSCMKVRSILPAMLETICVFTYAFDLARLTSIVDTRTLQPMCPCPEEVISTYYENTKKKLGSEYAEFNKDVRMAQFVEIASNYSPPGYYSEKEYNSIQEKELNRLAIAFYSKG